MLARIIRLSPCHRCYHMQQKSRRLQHLGLGHPASQAKACYRGHLSYRKWGDQCHSFSMAFLSIYLSMPSSHPFISVIIKLKLRLAFTTSSTLSTPQTNQNKGLTVDNIKVISANAQSFNQCFMPMFQMLRKYLKNHHSRVNHPQSLDCLRQNTLQDCIRREALSLLSFHSPSWLFSHRIVSIKTC